ncbi:MAG: hypothetical protein V4607_02175 [Pseudomonadota bacterium]
MILERPHRTAVVISRRAGVIVSSPDRAPVLIQRSQQSIVINRTRSAPVVNRVHRPVVINGGNQGPEGIQGIPGGTAGQILQAIAGVDLGGHRAIFIDEGLAFYADADMASAERVAGITLGAAADSELANYQTAGEITEPSWNWNEGPVFLGLNGLLTQTPPSTGAIIELGVALNATRLLVRIQRPIFL